MFFSKHVYVQMLIPNGVSALRTGPAAIGEIENSGGAGRGGGPNTGLGFSTGLCVWGLDTSEIPTIAFRVGP